MKDINVIAFDVPYPANYGGVIDVFYRIKYFHDKGIKVHLHCFEYGRGEQKILNKYCSTVNYYQRKTNVFSLLNTAPYIVKSRTSRKLKSNLLKNRFPIIFEGLHTCFLLNDKDLKSRLKIVRNHNIESNYYKSLSEAETKLLKKWFLLLEAKKLARFESILKNASLCLSVSDTDNKYFQKKYPFVKHAAIPCFHQHNEIDVKTGIGKYVLYHGNLSVPENINALRFIINNIFKDTDIPLIVAGLNPSQEIIDLIDKYEHIQIVKNPNDEQMNDLIKNAQINFLYTKQATGLKLKLLNALYLGRHCIVNSKMVEGTTLACSCIVENNVNKLKELIISNFSKEINPKEIETRKSILSKEYSNENGYLKIMTLISRESNIE